MTGLHLAEFNVARLRYPIDDSRVADFVDNLDRVNGIAERSKGFVWRLKDDTGNATEITLDDDPLLISNLSVWESVEDLERFVWDTVHRRFYERRGEWFEVLESQHFVMWWIEPGHVPDLAEARARLEHKNIHGDTDHAFGWAHLGAGTRWHTARCAAE